MTTFRAGLNKAQIQRAIRQSQKERHALKLRLVNEDLSGFIGAIQKPGMEARYAELTADIAKLEALLGDAPAGERRDFKGAGKAAAVALKWAIDKRMVLGVPNEALRYYAGGHDSPKTLASFRKAYLDEVIRHRREIGATR